MKNVSFINYNIITTRLSFEFSKSQFSRSATNNSTTTTTTTTSTTTASTTAVTIRTTTNDGIFINKIVSFLFREIMLGR